MDAIDKMYRCYTLEINRLDVKDISIGLISIVVDVKSDRLFSSMCFNTSIRSTRRTCSAATKFAVRCLFAFSQPLFVTSFVFEEAAMYAVIT